MSDNEQRCAIKFSFRLGHNATETFAKFQQAYGDNVLSRALVSRWFKAFSEQRESIEDESRSGRSSVSKTAEHVVRVRDLVRLDRRLTPPYSSDLSPCDFLLFPKLKNHLKGHHFGTLENIQTAVTDQLKATPISEFHQCYEEWKKRLQRCVASEGSYFEGDNVELTGRVYFWMTPSQVYDHDGLLPTVKHRGGFVMAWAAMSCFSAGPIVNLKGRFTAKKVFQDDSTPIHATRLIQSRFDEHEVEVKHLPWPTKSPDLNIIEPLWSVLEHSIRNRYPPAASLPELPRYLHEKNGTIFL
ncbi:DDE_3 domain-containing protein [Trichonephila clavipes]|nr:DDE_3 domain-containing protein [Trichonephila clavipes]